MFLRNRSEEKSSKDVTQDVRDPQFTLHQDLNRNGLTGTEVVKKCKQGETRVC